MKKLFTLAASAGFLMMPTSVSALDDLKDAVENNDQRTAEQMARDQYRNPYETLSFFGISADQTVIEVGPGGGWYTSILAPLLKENGKYVGLEHNPELYANAETYQKRLLAWPSKLEDARDSFGPSAVAGYIPADMSDASVTAVPAETVDTVIAIRAIHNWARRSFFDKAIDQTWTMLKPGGVFGVVQHRMPEDRLGDRHAHNRHARWQQSELVAAIESYGFKLEASSEMNANPKDTATDPVTVWLLPPSLSGDPDEETKAKRIAIGESDRMTLKFVKVDR